MLVAAEAYLHADPGMFIPDPDFYPSRIPDPITATKERVEKKLLSYLFL
jgi:hypothetical protein